MKPPVIPVMAKIARQVATFFVSALIAGCAASLGEYAPVVIDMPAAAQPQLRLTQRLASVPEPEAEGGEHAHVPLDTLLVAVDDQQLDAMRGGFEVDSGLKLSFGIERTAFINGQLVSSQTLNVGDLRSLASGLPENALAIAGKLGLIQNGAGNALGFDIGMANAVGNVIQNTANNQSIQTQTLINATVNSLQLARSINLQTTLQNGILDSMRR